MTLQLVGKMSAIDPVGVEAFGYAEGVFRVWHSGRETPLAYYGEQAKEAARIVYNFHGFPIPDELQSGYVPAPAPPDPLNLRNDEYR